MDKKGKVIYIDPKLERLLNKETIKRTTPDKILTPAEVARDILFRYFHPKS